ncbi:MAG TPA: hypothetical protein DEB39_11540 [Planctomycetaceae bacterium]|nr:hypothetical protein [Planctomycetaceae bacterium]
MRTLLLAFILGLMLLGSTGCILPIYSGDPTIRNEELINSSEGLRQIHEQWERFWFLDQPNHMTPYRTHGGII